MGANVKSKQILKYDLDGYYTEANKRRFQCQWFCYGLSTYLGYKDNQLVFEIRFESLV